MKLLDHTEIAIRQAFSESVQLVGGGKNMAALLHMDEPKISRLQNIENNEVAASQRAYLRMADAVRCDQLAGKPLMLSAMAALEGCTITRARRDDQPLDMHTHLTELLREFSEAMNEMREGGVPSVAKARRISAEVIDVINKCQDIVAECQHIIAGDNKPRLVEGGK